VYENTDIRAFTSEHPFDIVTCDVAFIPLELILESMDRLASRYIIVLFKPQFQVGREVKRDKNGVVKDDKAIGKAMIRFEDSCALLGWKMVAKEVAHIAGKEGNQEMCYAFIKG
jgi:23S rRNA (cytidine1920-2'-O)/16S rRNA (cytidine1409-2'-O)-methyltransferase